VVQKLSDLNYKIVDKKGKEFVVHVNRLKKSYDQTPWSFKNARRPRQEPRKPETFDEDVEIQSRPIAISDEREPQVVGTQALQEERLQLEQYPPAPGYIETPMQIEIGGGNRLIPHTRIQTTNLQIPRALWESWQQRP
jgi:hypothetical protein